MSSSTQPLQGGEQDQSDAIIGMLIATFSISLILLFLRFVVKIFIVKNLWWDDWTILLAYLGTTVGASFVFVEVHYGFGQHNYYISGPFFSRFLYYTFAEWIQIFMTLMFTKISICLFLYRIPATKALKRPLIAVIVVLLISHVALSLLWLLQCSPIKAAWDYTVPGNCFTKPQLLNIILAHGIISAISDFLLAAYPILILARVRISLRKKIGLCLLMSLGVITGACCVVRLATNWENESPDTTWDSVPNWMWRTVEVYSGLYAACIPAIYPGWRTLRRHYARRNDSETSLSKARLWLGEGKTTRAINDVSAGGKDSTLHPDVHVPESAILKTTEFGVEDQKLNSIL